MHQPETGLGSISKSPENGRRRRIKRLCPSVRHQPGVEFAMARVLELGMLGCFIATYESPKAGGLIMRQRTSKAGRVMTLSEKAKVNHEGGPLIKGESS
jgi:hypothetical protein